MSAPSTTGCGSRPRSGARSRTAAHVEPARTFDGTVIWTVATRSCAAAEGQMVRDDDAERRVPRGRVQFNGMPIRRGPAEPEIQEDARHRGGQSHARHTPKKSHAPVPFRPARR